MASQLPSTSASSPIDAALQVEYYYLQKTIEDFDGRALTIKAWSVTFGFASLVAAFASKERLVFVIAAVGALLFWLLEAFWKSFQLGYYERVWQIEAHFRHERLLDTPHQVSSTWQAWWQGESWWILARTAVWIHVALPHVFVVLVGLLGYGLIRFAPG